MCRPRSQNRVPYGSKSTYPLAKSRRWAKLSSNRHRPKSSKNPYRMDTSAPIVRITPDISEEVYIKAYGSVAEARQGIGGWLGFYNEKRPHQALDYRTPRAVHEAAACEYVDNASASLRDAPAL